LSTTSDMTEILTPSG